MTGIRYFSESNPWIDFVVLVDDEAKTDAKVAIARAMDTFWEDGDICYGDAVYAEMNKLKGVHFSVIFFDENLPESMWDDFLEYVKSKFGLEMTFE